MHRVIRDKAAAAAAGAAPLFIFWATVMKSAAPLRTAHCLLPVPTGRCALPAPRCALPLRTPRCALPGSAAARCCSAAASHGPTTLNPHV